MLNLPQPTVSIPLSIEGCDGTVTLRFCAPGAITARRLDEALSLARRSDPGPLPEGADAASMAEHAAARSAANSAVIDLFVSTLRELFKGSTGAYVVDGGEQVTIDDADGLLLLVDVLPRSTLAELFAAVVGREADEDTQKKLTLGRG